MKKRVLKILTPKTFPIVKPCNSLKNAFQKIGVETQYKYKGQTQEKQGISFKMGKICLKGSR
jgi:hypothetical protein